MRLCSEIYEIKMAAHKHSYFQYENIKLLSTIALITCMLISGDDFVNPGQKKIHVEFDQHEPYIY